MSRIKSINSMVDLAKRWGRGIGSVRLKDGSSVKILGSPDSKAVDLFRIKHGRILEAKGYRGEYAVPYAANDVGYIEEKLALDPRDVGKAWDAGFNRIV